MPYSQSPLPYALNALEPHISQETLEYHYGKHHKGYVEKLNAALEKNSSFGDVSLEEIVKTSQGGVYNNAAQIWNHEFYWECLSPHGGGESKEDKLKSAITESFGSFESLQSEFDQKSATLFGSGWTFLVYDQESSKLKITQEPNAGTPLTQKGQVPLLVCDVWEHAYYVDYRNARPAYLQAFWKVVNWDFVAKNFSAVA